MKSKQKRSSNAKQTSKLQLEQKLIYYRSELKKYETEIDQLKKRLRKKQAIEESKIADKINNDHEKIASEYNDGDKASANVKNDFAMKAYFSHSVFLPNTSDPSGDLQDPNIHVIGHFTIENTGTKPLNNPFICFRIKPAQQVLLSGKIRFREQPQNKAFAPMEEWAYIQEDFRDWIKTKGEHWLRPLHFQQIQPGEKKSFSNFDFTLEPSEGVSQYLVEGFVFSKEIQQGVPSSNSISIFLS
ncbi:hypothetical protein [Evansella halocellulosilytica]|uniref:hypothetical protein n=1 Tax=Evansella halocellulosilytica TaxID=2011013 RepID=UPI000BB7FDCE|nr:hypothetical protein [Evansella halocellulosilytica]